MTTDAVALREAGVHLGGRWIWQDVSLSVPAGEFVAIVGPNGAGKSTLLKSVLGVTPLTAGSVLLLGQAPHEAGSRIGYLPQRRTFDASTRIRGWDVVRLGLDGARWGFPLPGWISARSRAAHTRVREVVELVGATRYAGDPIGRLSGGEQQRLLIAQALVHRPQLLALDEPLDSLDLPNQAAIARLLQDICRDQAVTVLMVAHDLNPIMSYLDRVVYVAAGRALSGPPAEVVRTETLTRLYGTPVEVLHASDGRLVVVGAPDTHDHHGGHS